MNDPLDKAALLDAVATFLTEDLRPQIEDKSLILQVLTAANLARIVADEERNDHDYANAQLSRLHGLLPNNDVPSELSKAKMIQLLNQELALKIQAGEIPKDKLPAVWCHLTMTCQEQQAKTNPEIDARPPIV